MEPASLNARALLCGPQGKEEVEEEHLWSGWVMKFTARRPKRRWLTFLLRETHQPFVCTRLGMREREFKRVYSI